MAGFYNDGSGNGDTAYDAGNNSGSSYDGALAVAGNNNYASDSGNSMLGRSRKIPRVSTG
jgi:hypothetical protein